jgi:SAGA-associated factor 29
VKYEYVSFLSKSGEKMARDVDSEAILALLRDLAQDSCDLELLVNDLTAAFDGLYPPPHCVHQFSGISAKYMSVVSRLDNAINQSQKIMALFEGDPGSAAISTVPSALPSAAPSRSPSVFQMPMTPASRMVDYFMLRELPRRGMPYPPLCGALPQEKGEILPLLSFVASKIGADWVLCYIASCDDTGYLICDAESDSSASSIHTGFNQVIPLPTSLPDRRCRAAEFPVKTRVLALWPEKESWTTVFYGATVTKPPSETGEGYRLKFDGASKVTTVVPEAYVIIFPNVV